MFKKIIIFVVILSALIEASDDVYEYWESRFQTILSCNSKSGAAISEVKVTRIQSVPNETKFKIVGNYRQAMPYVASFGNLGTNNFAENTGVFQAFVEDETVIKAKYKISFIKGFVKQQCLKSNPNGFDF